MLAYGDMMCSETYFCNMWSTDLVWHTVWGLFRRHKVSVDGHYSAKDNAEIQNALYVV